MLKKLIRGAIHWGLSVAFGWSFIVAGLIWALGSDDYQFGHIFLVLGRYAIILFPLSGIVIELVVWALEDKPTHQWDSKMQ